MPVKRSYHRKAKTGAVAKRGSTAKLETAMKKAALKEKAAKKKFNAATKKLNEINSRRTKAINKKGWGTNAEFERLNRRFRPLLSKAKKQETNAASDYFKASGKRSELNSKFQDADFNRLVKAHKQKSLKKKKR